METKDIKGSLLILGQEIQIDEKSKDMKIGGNCG